MLKSCWMVSQVDCLQCRSRLCLSQLCASRSTVEGRIAAKLEPDTPATFGDSAGVALKDDKDQGEAPWKSTLPAMGQQHLVDEIMSDAMDELSPREEPPQEPQVSLTAQQ